MGGLKEDGREGEGEGRKGERKGKKREGGREGRTLRHLHIYPDNSRNFIESVLTLNSFTRHHCPLSSLPLLRFFSDLTRFLRDLHSLCQKRSPRQRGNLVLGWTVYKGRGRQCGRSKYLTRGRGLKRWSTLKRDRVAVDKTRALPRN